MNPSRLLRHLVLALLLPLVGTALADCAEKPYPWYLQKYKGANLRSSGDAYDFAPGPYALVASQFNGRSYARDLTLTTTATESRSWSAGIKEWFRAKRDTTDEETVTATVRDVPPGATAVLETRRRARRVYYTYDVVCVWRNPETGQTDYTTWLKDQFGYEDRRWVQWRTDIE